jgi:isochorismate pyruvate lyase
VSVLPAADCTTMAEIRAGVDDVDRRLVALLAERLGYMNAAARVKTERSAVRDEARKAQVIANASAEAAKYGLPADYAPTVWEALIEYSIAHEMMTFDGK